MSLGQIVAIVAAIALPWFGIQPGSPITFAFLAAAGGVRVWTAFQLLGGRYLTEWLRPAAAAVWSRLFGRHVYRGAVFGPNSLQRRMDLPGDLASMRMLSAPAPDGRTRVGLVLDEQTRTVTAALLTQGTPIILEESSEQAARLADWEAVMESTCDEDSAIVRWQLLFRSMPDSTNMAQQYYVDNVVDRDTLPAQALRE